jgi:sterol desaturase/sphingolipid hydroxylase (fatty acid hydroxylase superfamily)
MLQEARESASVPASRRAGALAESVVARLAFPVVTGSAIAAAIHWLEQGIDPFQVFVMAQVPAFAAVIALERVFPLHPEWSRSHGDVWVDVRHLATITLFGALIAPLLFLAGLAVASFATRWLGSPLWPDAWPLAAQLALALVAGELGQYWVHRLQHEKDWLWRFHAVHHSAPRLYWLNASRFHFLDIGLLSLGGNLVLIALGAPVPVLMLWILFSAIHGIFQHCNVPVRIGPLNWIFSMAELHRWHHSRLVAESNANYGQNLAIWDVVFGTRFLPADREPPAEIGLAQLPDFPMTWWAQILSPFRWRRVAQESRGAMLAPARGDP